MRRYNAQARPLVAINTHSCVATTQTNNVETTVNINKHVRL